MAAAGGGRLYTIAPGAPFLETLADALLDGALLPGFAPRADPLALAAATLYLPTRRSIRALRRIMLERLGTGAALLPRMVALGEVDEEEAAFDAVPFLDAVPEAVAGLDRQVALTRLILAWSRTVRRALLAGDGEEEPLLIPSSPGDAAALAADLGRFIDGLTIEGVDAARIAGLAREHEGRYDRYWDITLQFLAIATGAWPRELEELGRIDAAGRQKRLIEAEARRIAGLRQPVVVAGSTGSIPATRLLMQAVARLPMGAVVLPGLDCDLDEASWRAIEDGEGAPGHPQAGLRALLRALGTERDAVRPLGAVAPDRALRARVLSDVLRPAATTDAWAAEAPDEGAEDAAFAGVALVEAANETEEALAIALALREALETPGRCAALVTPDRGLAARVVAELGRWGIEADDSAGRPLLSTPPGIFARLVLDVALSDFAAVPVLALLKHPFSTLGIGRGAVRRAGAALEAGALRGPRPPAGIEGLRTALARARESLGERFVPAVRRRLGEGDWAEAAALLDALDAALSPLRAALAEDGEVAAARLFAAHVAAVEAAAAGGDELYAREAGQGLADFAADLLRLPPQALALPPVEYPGLFAALAAQRSVRGTEPRHEAIAIYGLLEARLLPVDRIILGGLDEGVWPPAVRIDPWLNRPMRAALDLPAPERRIGLTAHDFEQALGAPEVIVTRALKRGGSPTVASRWLQRLAAARPALHAAVAGRGRVWLDRARRLDAPAAVAPVAAPEPRPPLALRPATLSVTEIGTLIRDPYAVYARHVLGLERLEAVAAPAGAAERGTLIHEAAALFARLCEAGVPPDALAQFDAIAAALFAGLDDFPDIRAFWRPRLARAGAFLAGWEARRRPRLAAVAAECSGRLSWPTKAGRAFLLRARADRLETEADGLVRIVDFKTGAPPSPAQVRSGLEPQLALEAAMVLAGAFEAVLPPPGLAGLMVVRLGALGAPDEPMPLKLDEPPEAVAARALAGLKSLIDRFEDEEAPYASRLHPMFARRYAGDYDHLARVAEWSQAGEEDEA